MTDKDYNRAWVTHITILKKTQIDNFLERIYKDKMVPIKSDSFFKKRYLFNSKGDSTQYVQGLDAFFKGSKNDVANLKKVELYFYSDYALLLSTFAVRRAPDDKFEKLKTGTWSRNRNGNITGKQSIEKDSVISFFLKQIAKNYTPSSIADNTDNSSEIEIITPGNYVCEKSPLHADWEENEHLLCEQDSLGSSFMFVMAASTDEEPQNNEQILLNIEQIANCQCHKNFTDKKYRKQFSTIYAFSQHTGQSIVRFSNKDIREDDYDKYLTLFVQTLIQKIDCYLRCNELKKNNTQKVTKKNEEEAYNLLEQAKELKRKIGRNLNTTPEGITTVWLATTDSKGLLDDVSLTCDYILNYNVKQKKDRTERILEGLTVLTIISALNDFLSIIFSAEYPTWAKLGSIVVGLVIFALIIVLFKKK